MVKKISWFIWLPILTLWLPLSGAKEFKVVESWNHGIQPFSYVWFSTIGADGSVIALFYKAQGIRCITQKKIESFGFQGEAPDDLMYASACFPYKNDIGFYELMMNRIKVFTKTEKGMKWKETIWFKRENNLHFIREILFADDKFFCAGEGELPEAKQFFLLNILDIKGQPIKKLLQYQQEGFNKHAYMRRHLLPYQDQVFLISENELRVHVISTKDLSVTADVKLTVPVFYKKMPESFFTTKEYSDRTNGFNMDIEEWSGGYSRIAKAVMDGNYIVLAIRTMDPNSKRFCLLHYRADTFQLVNQVFIEDFLLGARDGRYYCYANGEPGVDENTDTCIIKVYQWVDTK